jgi:hypothetical protein
MFSSFAFLTMGQAMNLDGDPPLTQRRSRTLTHAANAR